MRGFLYASVRSLLVSLWNVNDESTAARWRVFIGNGKRQWINGFQESQLAARPRPPNLLHWAPFLRTSNPLEVFIDGDASVCCGAEIIIHVGHCAKECVMQRFKPNDGVFIRPRY